MINVGWDLDGVCYDFGDSVRRYLIDKGTHTAEDVAVIDNWHFYRDWGLTDEEFVQTCHDGVDAGVIFTYGEPHPGSVEAMNKLFLAGYPTLIVTDRSFGAGGGKGSRDATNAFLEKHGYMYDQIYFTADKTTVDLDYMIDDKTENFEALHAVGVECYLLDRPWNQHCKAGPYRINSIQQYVDTILTESAATLPVYGSA